MYFIYEYLLNFTVLTLSTPQGSVRQLQELKGWRGHSVLYFGDHPYSDLADVTLKHSWRTGAIISELNVSITCI